MASNGPDMEHAPSERTPPELPRPERPVVPLPTRTTHPETDFAGQQRSAIGSNAGSETFEEDHQPEPLQSATVGAPDDAEMETTPPEDSAVDDQVQEPLWPAAAAATAAAAAPAAAAAAAALTGADMEHSPPDIPETLGTPPGTPSAPLKDKGSYSFASERHVASGVRNGGTFGTHAKPNATGCRPRPPHFGLISNDRFQLDEFKFVEFKSRPNGEGNCTKLWSHALCFHCR